MKELNFDLIGDRILIKLDEARDHTVTESGLVIPLQQLAESDGGRVVSEISKQKHLPQGTIMKMGPLAAKKLEEVMADVTVGDKVFISTQVFNSKSYEFSTDRSQLLREFDGYICIPHVLIEAKITTT